MSILYRNVRFALFGKTSNNKQFSVWISQGYPDTKIMPLISISPLFSSLNNTEMPIMPALCISKKTYFNQGGEKTDGAVLGSCEQYHTETDTWCKIGALPSPRRGHACLVDNNRILHVSGGLYGKCGRRNIWYDEQSIFLKIKLQIQFRYEVWKREIISVHGPILNGLHAIIPQIQKWFVFSYDRLIQCINSWLIVIEQNTFQDISPRRKLHETRKAKTP